MAAVINKVVWCDRGWFPVFYGFCPSEAAWRREMKRFGIKNEEYPTSDGRCSSFTNKDGDLCIIVTIANEIDKKNDPAGIVGLLVHEGVHVWQNILEHIGEGKPSREFEAYSMQAIVGQLLGAYATTRKPRFKI